MMNAIFGKRGHNNNREVKKAIKNKCSSISLFTHREKHLTLENLQKIYI